MSNGNRITLVTTLVVILTIGTPMAIADPLVIPNEFSAGQPASAAEVNANFSAVKSSIDDNDSRITDNSAPVVTDGGSARIGTLVSISDDVGFVFAKILSDQSFIFQLRLADGSLETYPAPLLFNTVDCSGTAYLTNNPGGFASVAFDLAGVPRLYYVAKGSLATAENFQFSSMTTGGGCMSQAGTVGFGWSAAPNDPAVTGISNSAYSVPITID